MRKAGKSTYEVVFNENNQEFVIAGKLRPRSGAEIENIIALVTSALENVRGTLYFNVKRLARLNNVAFRAIVGIISEFSERRDDLRIEIITSSVMGWSTRKFLPLAKRHTNGGIKSFTSTSILIFIIMRWTNSVRQVHGKDN